MKPLTVPQPKRTMFKVGKHNVYCEVERRGKVPVLKIRTMDGYMIILPDSNCQCAIVVSPAKETQCAPEPKSSSRRK